MRHVGMQLGLAALLVLGAATAADAATAKSCLDKINDAVTLAGKLPASAGRAAVMTDIARARDARHEGDEEGCMEQVDETLALLREHRKPRASR